MLFGAMLHCLPCFSCSEHERWTGTKISTLNHVLERSRFLWEIRS